MKKKSRISRILKILKGLAFVILVSGALAGSLGGFYLAMKHDRVLRGLNVKSDKLTESQLLQLQAEVFILQALSDIKQLMVDNIQDEPVPENE